MRTDVHEAYDGADTNSSAMDVVFAVVARLREYGLAVSTAETMDAAHALGSVELHRRPQVRAALHCTLLRTSAHDAVLDRVLDELLPPPRRGELGGAKADATAASKLTAIEFQQALADALADDDQDGVLELADAAVQRWAGVDRHPSTPRHHANRLFRTLDLEAVLRMLLAAARDRNEFDRSLTQAKARDDVTKLRALLEQLTAVRLGVVGTPDHHRMPIEDLEILTASSDELVALRAAVRPLARRLAARLGRRNRRGRGQLDMRRTIRRSIASGGVAFDPVTRRRARTKPALVVLCDVSGSVATFAPFTLALLHALHDEFPRVRSWVFVDGIVEITGIIGDSHGMLDPNHLLARRGLVTGDGRSDYRAVFSRFRADWPDLVSPRTTVLVVGDGRSHERPPGLAELTELARSARRLYWLNPEPAREWNTDDSRIDDYGARCTAVFEVSTLRQLEDCVARIAA